MQIEFNKTGAERKALVNAISAIIGENAVYQFMPTCAYKIGCFTVTKDGSLTFDDRADSEVVESLLEQLVQQGFTPAEADTADQDASVGLTISVPLDKVNCGNLTRLLEAKGSLICKALGVNELPIEIGEDKVSFPWFSKLPESEECETYSHFICALCEMSVTQKRITATEKPVDNEKYAFRCFLLRLGFIGSEYKNQRKILLRNLTGSSAFKSGAKKNATTEGNSGPVSAESEGDDEQCE